MAGTCRTWERGSIVGDDTLASSILSALGSEEQRESGAQGRGTPLCVETKKYALVACDRIWETRDLLRSIKSSLIEDNQITRGLCDTAYPVSWYRWNFRAMLIHTVIDVTQAKDLNIQVCKPIYNLNSKYDGVLDGQCKSDRKSVV